MSGTLRNKVGNESKRRVNELDRTAQRIVQKSLDKEFRTHKDRYVTPLSIAESGQSVHNVQPWTTKSRKTKNRSEELPGRTKDRIAGR